MGKWINPNILDEGNYMKILEEKDDPMETIVQCNNCGQPAIFGHTRMVKGFVGCDNSIEINGEMKLCFYQDLLPRVIKYCESEEKEEHQKYVSGKVYRWRDGER